MQRCVKRANTAARKYGRCQTTLSNRPSSTISKPPDAGKNSAPETRYECTADYAARRINVVHDAQQATRSASADGAKKYTKTWYAAQREMRAVAERRYARVDPSGAAGACAPPTCFFATRCFAFYAATPMAEKKVPRCGKPYCEQAPLCKRVGEDEARGKKMQRYAMLPPRQLFAAGCC